jgi:hypothetical protein
MNISTNNLLTISKPTAAGNAAHSQSKGPAAAGKFSLPLSSETNVKTKTDKKPAVNTTNPTGDTTESQPNITQPTAGDTSEQNPKIKPPQTQQEDSDTQPSTTGLTLAYLISAQNAAQPAKGGPDIKPPVEITGQDNPQTIQNNDKETTIDTKPEKIKPSQQIPNTEDQKTQNIAIRLRRNLPMTAEPLKAAQTGNEPTNEEQAEKTAGKNNQLETKLQSADDGQNQQIQAQNISNTIPNKTETLLPDDHKKLQIQITADKDSGGNESAFGTLSNNQPAQNDQKIPSSQNISNDFKLPPDLSGQIQESAKALLTSNKNQVTIRLNPPELGSVCLKVSDNGHQITGLLQITKPETKYEIQQLLPGIIRNLEDAGISVKSFDVVLNNQPDQQTAQQSLYQQNDQNSYIPNRDSTADYQTFNYSLNNETGLQAISSSQRITASAGSLNILM